MKPSIELPDGKYMTSDEIASLFNVTKRTFLERYAPRPDFPARISITQKTYFWEKSEIEKYFRFRKEKRPR